MSKGDITRDRILDVAFRLAAAEGLERLSLADIARGIGISKSGIFAHFQSKGVLQVEMLKTGADKFVRAVMAPAFEKPCGLPRLHALFHNWMEWANSPSLPGGCLLMAASVEVDDRDGPLRDVVVSLQRDLLGALAR